MKGLLYTENLTLLELTIKDNTILYTCALKPQMIRIVHSYTLIGCSSENTNDNETIDITQSGIQIFRINKT